MKVRHLTPLFLLLFNPLASAHKGHSLDHKHHSQALTNVFSSYELDFSANLEVYYLTRANENYARPRVNSYSQQGINSGHNEFSVVATNDVSRIVTTIALANHGHGHGHGHNSIEVELEETFFEFKPNQYGIAGKIGRMHGDFGIYNKLHLHDFAFTETPLIYRSLFGGHPYTDNGISISYSIIPNKLKITYQALSGKDLVGLGIGVNGEDTASVGVQIVDIDAPMDLTDNSSMRLNLAYMNNKNGKADFIKQGAKTDWAYMTGTDNYLLGIHTDIKNIVSPFDGNSLHLGGEYFYIDDISNTTKEHNKGYYFSAIYNISEQWKVGTRYSNAKQYMPLSETSSALINTSELEFMVGYSIFDNLDLIAEYSKMDMKFSSVKYPKQYITKLTARYQF